MAASSVVRRIDMKLGRNDRSDWLRAHSWIAIDARH
jgi:hypothetical protein